MQIFTGRYNVSLDSKGRLAIPAKLRQVATADGSEEFFVSTGTNQNLSLFSESGFKDKAILMKSSKPIDSDEEDLWKRRMFASTAQVKPDKQGRILIPPKLREYAGIEGEAIVIGVGEKMEIWREDVFDEYLRQAESAKK